MRLVAPARTIGGGAVVLGSAQRHRPPSPWDAGRVRLALALPQGVLSPTSLHTPRTCELSQPAGGRREHFQGRDREREAGLACCCTKPPTPQHSSSWAPSSAASCAGGQEAAGFAQTKGARTRCSTSAPRRAQRSAPCVMSTSQRGFRSCWGREGGRRHSKIGAFAFCLSSNICCEPMVVLSSGSSELTPPGDRLA